METHVLSAEDTSFNRTTDNINPHTLHTDTVTSYLTLNPTVWQNPLTTTPTFFIDSTIRKVTCADFENPVLGEYDPPVSNFKVLHTAQQYRSVVGPAATSSDFEQVAKYPHFVRTVVYYDSLPPQLGGIWSRFPRHTRWDSLAPTGKVRNLLGKQAAIAYREHGGEPFHYTVMSYDERGRLEAMLRFTENLGYDAVYYRYNSMNQLVEVKVEDPLNMHRSLYGYDWNGRVDSVWAVFTKDSGLHMGGQFKKPYYHHTGNARNDTADIVYRYTKLGAVDSMRYPLVGVVVNYDYNKRKWLDSITATKGGNPLFKEVLGYDSSGQIVWQRYKHGTQAEERQDYLYDRIDRLIGWFGTGMPDTLRYTYDAVGNRLTDSLTWREGDYRYGQATGVGPNRLMRMVDSNVQTGMVIDSTRYTYDRDGATTRRIRVDLNAMTTVDEKFKYSYRDLLRRYTAGPGGTVIAQDWRYRYDPFGEREQKRMYYIGIDTLGAGYQHPWVYYLLGAQKEQLAVWHGMETCDSMCSDTGQRVYMYPVEYITNAIQYNGVIEDINHVSILPNGQREYRISDHVASLRVEIDSGLTSQYAYDPWGEISYSSSGTEARRGFNHRVNDSEMDVHDHGDRSYDSKLGRFLRVDRLWENSNSESPYVYCQNDPLNVYDPNGLQGRRIETRPLEMIPFSGQGFGPEIGGALVPSKEAIQEAIQGIAADLLSPGGKSSNEPKPGSLLNLVSGATSGATSSGAEPRFYRGGSSWESTSRLKDQAERAEKNGYGYGISVFDHIGDPGRLTPEKGGIASASQDAVRKLFNVKRTGNTPGHYTVELPKPVTPEVATTFNKVFGRTKR